MKNNKHLLADINPALSALMKAQKIQEQAASVGFDWIDLEQVLGKVKEELQEIEHELNQENQALEKIEEEIGDLIFTCVNLARHCQINSEAALGKANRKFSNRFAYIEQTLWRQGRDLSKTSLDEMELLWNAAKAVQYEK